VPTLHIRNVPKPIYDRLRQRAQERNRSLSAEALFLLDYALEETAVPQSEILNRIRRRRFFNPASVNAPDSATLLRQAREAGPGTTP
jgi:antitoxin FitA